MNDQQSEIIHEDPFEIIKKLNTEYIGLRSSKEYLIGKSLYEVRSMGIRTVLAKIRNNRRNKQLRRKKLLCTKTPIRINAGQQIKDDLKVIVYSCVTGKYDQVEDPYYVGNNTEYYLFTDQQENIDVWITKEVNKYHNDNILTNRYYKMHPFDVLTQCDYSIYIDGRVQTVSDVRPLCAIASESPVGIAMHTHSTRDCIYQEAESCLILNKGNKDKIIKQVERYRKEKFPEHFGLYEATIIVVDHHNKTAKRILDEWWNEFIVSGSNRDQIALPYCIWKKGYDFSDIGCLGNCKEKNPVFRMLRHR